MRPPHRQHPFMSTSTSHPHGLCQPPAPAEPGTLPPARQPPTIDMGNVPPLHCNTPTIAHHRPPQPHSHAGTIFLSRDPSHTSRFWPVIVPGICDLPFTVLRGGRLNPGGTGFPATFRTASRAASGQPLNRNGIVSGTVAVAGGPTGPSRPLPVWVFNTDLFGWVCGEWCRGFDEGEAECLLDDLDEEMRTKSVQGSELD